MIWLSVSLDRFIAEFPFSEKTLLLIALFWRGIHLDLHLIQVVADDCLQPRRDIAERNACGRTKSQVAGVGAELIEDWRRRSVIQIKPVDLRKDAPPAGNHERAGIARL